MAKKDFPLDIDLMKNELQNSSFHKLSTPPSNPVVGQFYYDTVDSRPYYWNGSIWVDFDPFINDIIESGPQYSNIVIDSVTGKLATEPIYVTLTDVIENAVTTPPTDATAEDAYIIPIGATGVWTGLTNQIAIYNGATWDFYIPQVNDVTTILTGLNAGTVKFDGNDWIPQVIPTVSGWQTTGNTLTSAGKLGSLTSQTVQFITGGLVRAVMTGNWGYFGFGTSTPDNTVEVDGTFGLTSKYSTVIPADGIVDSGKSFYSVSGFTTPILKGIYTGHLGIPGRFLYLVNKTGSDITIIEESTVTANRRITTGIGNVIWKPNTVSQFQYNKLHSRWQMVCPPMPETDPLFTAWLALNPTSGTNTGDQDLTPYLLKDTTLQTTETPTDTSLFSSWNGTARVKSTLLEIWNVLKAKADAIYVPLTLRFEKHTGFYSANDPRNKKILVTYNGDKTVTLSRSDGTFQGYFDGMPIAGLTNGYTSPVIPTATPTGLWFLYHNGTSIIWSQTPFLFSHCMITIAYFRDDGTFLFVVPETHGFMPEADHEEFHRAIGAYGYSGNGVSGYTLNSTVATNRRPTFEAGVIADEDKHTDLLAMSGNYTRSWITSGGSITSDWNNTEIIPLNGNRPIINVITNGLGSQVDITNNNYCAVFVFKIAVGADADSQRYRCVILQPQHQGTLTQMQAVNYTAVNINGLTGISNEIIFTQKIIVRYTGANWSITSIENISGNARFSVISSGATAGVNEMNVTMDARTNLTGTTLDANANIIDSQITQQITSNASSGTIDLPVNTLTVLSTTLSNSHTITVTPTAPTAFIRAQLAQLDFTTDTTTPSITLTAPSGVTFKWRHAEITAWTASKTYTIQFVWISSTRCDIYYLIS